MELRDEELTGAIIEAAIEVHRRLGPGFRGAQGGQEHRDDSLRHGALVSESGRLSGRSDPELRQGDDRSQARGERPAKLRGHGSASFLGSWVP